MHDTLQDIVLLQQEDLNMFGRLIFSLCCNNITATSGQNIQKSLDFIGRNYSTELKEVAIWFTSRMAPIRVSGISFQSERVLTVRPEIADHQYVP